MAFVCDTVFTPIKNNDSNLKSKSYEFNDYAQIGIKWNCLRKLIGQFKLVEYRIYSEIETLKLSERIDYYA